MANEPWLEYSSNSEAPKNAKGPWSDYQEADTSGPWSAYQTNGSEATKEPATSNIDPITGKELPAPQAQPTHTPTLADDPFVQGFNQSIERQGGWGLSPETLDALGYNSKIPGIGALNRAILGGADLATRGFQGAMAGAEGAANVLDKASEVTGLADALSWDGNRFMPGQAAMALMEAFPDGGGIAGISHPVLPSAAKYTAADRLAMAQEAEGMLSNGATLADMQQWAAEKGLDPFGKDLEAAITARDTRHQPVAVADLQPEVSAAPHKPAEQLNLGLNEPLMPESVGPEPTQLEMDLTDNTENTLRKQVQSFKSAKKPEPTQQELIDQLFGKPTEEVAPSSATPTQSVEDWAANLEAAANKWKNKEEPRPIAEPAVSAEEPAQPSFDFGPETPEHQLSLDLQQPKKTEPTKVSDEPSADVTAAVAHINELARGWKNAPNIRVAQNWDDLPKDERADLDPNATGAIMPDGSVYLHMDNIKAEADALGVPTKDIVSSTVFHESLGHHGLDQKFGRELDDTLLDLYHNGNAQFKEKVDEWVADNGDAYAEDYNPLARAIEEVLAEDSERGAIKTTVMEKIVATIRKYARKAGIDLTYSKSEIRSILSQAHEGVINGVKDESFLGRNVRNRTRRDKIKAATEALASTKNGETKTVQPFPEEEPDYWRFRHVTKDGKPVTGTYTVEGTKIDNLSISSEGGAKSIGAEGIRAIARDLKSNHPETKTIGGYRISGAREEPKFVSARYSRRKTIGKGSEGSLQGGSRKTAKEEGQDYLGVGPIRSQHMINDILKENAPEDQTAESWNDWIDEADALRNKVQRAKALKTGATAPEVLSAREAIVKSANRIAKLSRKAADGSLSPREEYMLFAEMARNADMQDALQGVRSNAARIVNSFKIPVETDEAFSSAIRHAMRSTDNELWSNPKYKKKLIQQLAQHATNPNAVKTMIKAAFKPKAEDYIFRVWYNMLLSGLPTHVTNFAGTGFNFAADIAEHAGAAFLGQGKRMTGAERVYGREVGYRMWGALKAMAPNSKTWSEARKALNTGETGNSVASKAGGTMVRQPSSNAGADAMSGFLEAPSRTLAGADEWWRNVLQLSNMYGLAARKAISEGHTGIKLSQRISDLVTTPTPEMVSATNDYTKVLQFMDSPSWLGKALRNAQTPGPNATIPERFGKGVLRVAVPFVRTPDSLIRTAIRRSGPLGILERENINGWKAGGAKRDVVAARLIMGSLLSAWVASKAFNEEITGNGPADFKKKQEWLGSHQENSIKIGKDYYSIAGLEPVSTNITGVASLVEQYKYGDMSDKDFADKAIGLTQAMAGVLVNNSYLQNFQNFMDITADDPTKAKNALTNFVASTASSIVPAAVRKSAQVSDPAVRDTTGSGSIGDRIAGRIEAGLPGTSEDLPQKYDVYGRPMVREELGPDYASRTQIKEGETDPGIKELQRLGESTGKVIVGAAGKSVKVDGEMRKLSAEEYQQYQKETGEYITKFANKLVSSPNWSSLPDDAKISIVKKIVEEVRKAVREDMFPDKDTDTEEGTDTND